MLELECRLLENFDDYRTNCARVLRDIGARRNAEECLQWAVDNTNVFVIRVESTGAMRHWNRVQVSYSESPLAEGTVVLIERGDGTSHVFCKMYSGSSNRVNSSEEYASTHSCTAEEVHAAVSNMLSTVAGQSIGAFVSIEGQHACIAEVCNCSTVGSRSPGLGSQGEQDPPTITQEVTVTAYSHDTAGLMLHVEPKMREDVVLIATGDDQKIARRHLLRWAVILRDIYHDIYCRVNRDDIPKSQEYVL